LIAASFSAVIFGTIKYSVLERKDSFKWAMRLIPIYIASTRAILTLFLAIEVPTSTVTEGGPLVGTVLGVFSSCLLFAYIFFIPFFKRKLVMEDRTIRIWHVFYGPLLLKDDIKLLWPSKADDELVVDPYNDPYSAENTVHANDEEKTQGSVLLGRESSLSGTEALPHSSPYADKTLNRDETVVVRKGRQQELEER
jgi:hypothetical protein